MSQIEIQTRYDSKVFCRFYFFNILYKNGKYYFSNLIPLAMLLLALPALQHEQYGWSFLAVGVGILTPLLTQKLVQAVSAVGGKAWKFTSPGTAGVPDRILLFPSGRMAFAELKAPGKHLRPLQKRRKIQLEHLGFTVFVIDDPEQIGEVLWKMEGGTGH